MSARDVSTERRPNEALGHRAIDPADGGTFEDPWLAKRFVLRTLLLLGLAILVVGVAFIGSTLGPGTALAHSSTHATTVRRGTAACDTPGDSLVASVASSSTSPGAVASGPEVGPGGPILLVTSSATRSPSYYTESCAAEGLDAFATVDIGTLDTSALAAPRARGAGRDDAHSGAGDAALQLGERRREAARIAPRPAARPRCSV